MFFSNMKEKRQKAYRIKAYDEILTEVIISMFVWDGIAEELKERENLIEETLLLNGAVAIFKLTKKIAGSINKSYIDKYISTEVQFSGEPDVYGIGIDAICTTDNGISVTFENWRENPDIVIIFNNSNFSPDVNIGRYSDILAEVETSEKLQTIFSRLYPIPIVKNSKVQRAVEEAISNMLNGKIATILDEEKISKYIQDATKEAIESVALTEPEKVQYIQYLSKFHDDLMRRFYGLYGMDESGNSKMAQQSVDEINRNDESSMIIPHDMYKWRLKGCEDLKKKFGWTEANVMFSECWQSRDADINVTDEKTEEDNENGLEENSVDDSGNNIEDEKSEKVKEEEGEKEDAS